MKKRLYRIEIKMCNGLWECRGYQIGTRPFQSLRQWHIDHGYTNTIYSIRKYTRANDTGIEIQQ